MKQSLTIVKVGGKIVEDAVALAELLDNFKNISGNKILVHGGGRTATQVAAQLGYETKMIDGRRVTDSDMLRVVTMVYGGLVNKNIVAGLNSRGICALGMTGADCGIIVSHKREAKPVDYGFVGDVDEVDSQRLASIINQGITPVLAPLTFDGHEHLLNTNADTMAGETAKALAPLYDVRLVFCFEKEGVLRDENDDTLIWDGARCEPTFEPIDTYEDHRMAMAFAPAAIKYPGLKINNPEVVSKSYPHFWEDLKQAGFEIREINN